LHEEAVRRTPSLHVGGLQLVPPGNLLHLPVESLVPSKRQDDAAEVGQSHFPALQYPYAHVAPVVQVEPLASPAYTSVDERYAVAVGQPVAPPATTTVVASTSVAECPYRAAVSVGSVLMVVPA
jgi:hypothetical protein